MNDDSGRNTIIFLVCALALFIVYQVFVLEPAQRQKAAEAKAHPPAAAAAHAGAPALSAPPVATRAAAVAASPRVPLATPSLKGSVSLRGARIDDLFLTQYAQTTDKNSPPEELLKPEGTAFPWFVDFGWVGQNVPNLPGPLTVWTLSQGATLAPGAPVTLTYSNGAGLTFTRRIEVDQHYMFTVTDTVANTGAGAVTLAPYGTVQRQGVPPEPGRTGVVHEGVIGYLAGHDRAFTYKDLSKDAGQTQQFDSAGAWTGITDRYWLTALIPAAAEQVHAVYRDAKAGNLDVYEANYTGAARTIAPNTQITVSQHLFAGAKKLPLLQAYEKDLGIAHFDDAIDWGRFFFFLTRPIYLFLTFIYQRVGTFGVAILMLTVVVRLAFFPIANKQYESMTKMKKVQPLMEELRRRFKDDPAKQQQEIMALYQREKVNPLAGCLPILLQIPVFYSLYKVLNISIEMRHAPFLAFNDLSARDPTTIWNLFGAIPWNPAHAPLIGGILDTSLHIGILPLAYGFTMFLTTSMSPQTGVDPTQQRIFQLMPLFFMFIMAPFAVGLLIYWTWSNVLTTLQQYVMMRRFKVDNPIDRFFARLGGKKAPAG
ncbi:membrane protein insertase YidC [Phenylobacterium sp.]|jgi:YidC/Oxa1 family membrane protein insertase|uniref:membrane protein insertase YidC n=1 Tax=Phenylobacterium sp. TaxID=1871053 RepID=UPI002F3F3CFC